MVIHTQAVAIENFSLRHYILFIKTRPLLPLHHLIVPPHVLVPKPCALLFPPARDCQGSWPPLLRHRNVKNRPRSNSVLHTVVTAGDVLPYFTQTCFRLRLTNGSVLPLYILASRNTYIHPLRGPIMQEPQCPHNVGHYDP